jgi:DNA helicase-2/ATP-dependent DNA helicase PcrA
MRALYLTYARRRAVFGAQTYGMPSRFLSEIPGELLEQPDEGGGFRAGALGGGFVPASSRRGGSGSSAETAWGEPGRRPAAGGVGGGNPGVPPGPSFRLGEDVVHAAFGDGVVTGVEPDGVIVVRFAEDGSERKLMAEYAPVTRR